MTPSREFLQISSGPPHFEDRHHAIFTSSNGEDDPIAVITRANEAISSAPIDVSFVGIGENGHLAFNDPPADFNTEAPYILVKLDELAASSRSAKAGSRISRAFQPTQSRCPFSKC